MNNVSEAVTIEAVEIVKQTIRESMGPFGLRDVHVRAGEDHDGDPVLFIEALYDLSETPVDPSVTARLVSILRDRLWKFGERRFPHIRHKFDEHQEVQRARRAKA